MKNTLNILCVLLLTVLVSCTPGADTQPNDVDGQTPVDQSENGAAVTDDSGSVVLELENPSQLAGETLTFEVTVEQITKAEGNTEADTVEVNDDIEVNYVGTLDDGEEFDSSYTRNQTLPFTVGVGQMIPGFDNGVLWMKLNEEKTLVLEPEDAYGPATIRETVSIAELRQFVGEDFEIAVGATIPTQGGDATIVELQD